MARFFVHIVEDDGRVVDESGHEARDLQALIELLRDAAAEIIHREVAVGHPVVKLTFHVEDEGHNQLLEFPVEAHVPKLDGVRPMR